jgi:hypothetical protein
MQTEARGRARQASVILRKTHLQRLDTDLAPISGPEGVALVRRLTAESWSIAGFEDPTYTCDHIPWRFVPGRSV